MSWLGKGLDVLAVLSAAWLLALLIRRASGKTAELIRPLLIAVLFFNGMDLVVIVASRLPRTAVLSMAADTVIFGLKFGWLFAFLTFLHRFALPLEKRLFRRLVAAAVLPVILLLAGGWLEFLLTSKRGLFNNLQYVSDYVVFFAMIGAGFYLRYRTSVLVSREAAKAMIVLGGLTASIFLVLGLWWIVGDSVSHIAPAFEAAFIPLCASVINVGLGLWVLRFSKVLAGPELMRFAPRRISENILSRWGISRREGEIIELVAQGLSNQEIADRLFISLFTVKKHLNNVFLKTGVTNRVQLVRLFPGSVPHPTAGSDVNQSFDGSPGTLKTKH